MAGGVPQVVPRFRHLWSFEPERPSGRLSIGHTPKLVPAAHLLSPRDCAALELTLGDLDLRAFGDLFFGPLNTCPWSWRRGFGGGRLHLGVVDARLALAVVPCVATEALAI